MNKPIQNKVQLPLWGVPNLTPRTLHEVLRERVRQDAIFGECKTPVYISSYVQDGFTVRRKRIPLPLAANAQEQTEENKKLGIVDLFDVLLEEFLEANEELRAGNFDLAREELIQVAATAVLMVEEIDKKKKRQAEENALLSRPYKKNYDPIVNLRGDK